MKKKRQPQSEETKRKISLSCKGRKAWNKGTKGLIKPNKGSFQLGSQGHLGYKHSQATKEHISRMKIGRYIGERNPRWNPNRHSNEQIECACGCGTLIPKYDRKGRSNKWVVGHQALGKPRPDNAKTLKALWANGKLKAKRGEEHWNWKGGITPLTHLLRNTPEYKEWRLAVYARDHWTCQDCGRHCDEHQIVAHHKKPFKDYPELRYAVENGITLCRRCHLERERIITYGAS
jgi:5-methylcytosine-specific restriction endonuclease McrA